MNWFNWAYGDIFNQKKIFFNESTNRKLFKNMLLMNQVSLSLKFFFVYLFSV